MMKILSIETSCDETAAAVTEEQRVLSNVVFSQVDIHRQWGGVYPNLAKRAHQEKIDRVIELALKRAGTDWSQIDAVAVTFGPGLVIALEVGISKAKEIAAKHDKPLIPVDHLEGHLYSVFAQSRQGKPSRNPEFPFLGLIVSGGHTSLVLVKNHQRYEVIGKTLDDAAGEALDKAAKIMGLGYPGGPVIEKLAQKGDPDFLALPLPMAGTNRLDFSYSGLKTAFKYRLEEMNEKEINRHLPDLAASFQKAVFIQIIDRLEKTSSQVNFVFLGAGGGVTANQQLRRFLRRFGRGKKTKVYLPASDKLTGDNAAMIGVAAYFKYINGIYLEKDFRRLDRVARPDLHFWIKQ